MTNAKKNIHFNISERKVLLRLMDIVMVFCGLFVLEQIFGFEYLTLDRQHFVSLGVLILYLTVFGSVFEIYDLQKSSKTDVTFKNVVLTASTVVIFYMLTPVVTPFLPDKRMQIVYFYIAFFVSIFLWRLVYINFISSPRFYRKVLLVADISTIEHVIKPLQAADPNYKIVGFINSEQPAETPIKFKGLKEFDSHEILRVIAENAISEVLVATYNPETIKIGIYHDLMALLESGFVVREYTQVHEELTNKVPIQFVGNDFYKYFPYSRSHQNKLYQFFRSLFDVLLSIIGICFGLSLVPFILIGNLLGNKGPLFYTQERVGRNGETFKMLKFRTMLPHKNKYSKWTAENDIRITPFGNFLRRSRVDEIPQFFNVLKGDMSLIGPRPERPFYVNELSKSIPFYEMRHIIRPGLTGWAQTNFKYGTIEDSLEKLQYDLYYIKHRSFFLDMTIMVKTISTVIYYRGQ